MMRHNPGSRINAERNDLFRGFSSNIFDIHAAFGRHHKGNLGFFPIHQHGKIKFRGNIGAILDIKAPHHLARRAGLMGDQGHAQDFVGIGPHFIQALGNLDTAALAPPTGVDLRLDHINGSGQFFGRLDGFVNGKNGVALRYRRTKTAEHGFGLVFMNIHGASRIYAWSSKST